MSEVRIVRDYEQPPEVVWRALTEPALMAQWMIDALPHDFSPQVGVHFRFVGKPRFGWNGIVDCAVLSSVAPRLFRYSWVADEGDRMIISYHLEPCGEGTRFTFEHTGFKGIGGFFFAKAVIAPIRRKMFGARMEMVLAAIDRS